LQLANPTIRAMKEMIRPIFMKMIVGQQKPIVTPEALERPINSRPK
jgi:hypothetical protein